MGGAHSERRTVAKLRWRRTPGQRPSPVPPLQTPCSHYQQTERLIFFARVAGFYEKFGFQLRDPEMPAMNIRERRRSS
jgi:hypothetical protein